MRDVRRGLAALFALLMMVGVLVLATPPAEALSGPECDQGQLQDGQCLIEAGSPVNGPATCPVSGTVFLDGNECFELVPLISECPANSVPQGPDCRQPVDLQPGGLACAEGFGLIDGTCIRYEEPLTELTCSEGELINDNCVIPGIMVPGTPFCLDGTFVDGPDGPECYTLVAATITCPPGSVQDLEANCRVAEPLIPGPLTCADDFAIVDGECVRQEDPVVVLSCELGVLTGDVCVIEGEPPVQGPPTCPVSATVIEEDGMCFTLIAAIQQTDPCLAPYIQFGSVCKTNNTGTDEATVLAYTCPDAPGDIQENLHEIGGVTKVESCQYDVTISYLCPTGTTPHQTPDTCRRAVDLAPGPFVCADGFGLVDGSCLMYAPATVTITCSAGTLAGEVCVVLGLPPVPGPSTCPVSDTVFEDGAECYSLATPLQECPADTTPDPNGIDCRVPGEVLYGDLLCEDGFFLDENLNCVRYEEPIETLICAVGEIDLAVPTCIVVGDPPTNGPAFCPVSATVFEDGAECYSLVAPTSTSCPVGTTPDPSGSSCREPADLVPGPLVCAEGQILIAPLCYTVEDAVYRCLGLEVTVNMLLGDAGTGTIGNDVILGTAGPDTIFSGTGDDTICAGAGDDTIYAGTGADFILGEGGNDVIRGGSGEDRIVSGSGDDLVLGGADADAIWTGSGNDEVFGGSGNDRIQAGAGDDRIRGGTGNDRLLGTSGNDEVFGNAGDDVLSGGTGTDDCRGGPGSDTADTSCEQPLSVP